jgi:hypothetical protein
MLEGVTFHLHLTWRDTLRQSRAIKTAASELSPEVCPLPNSLKSATLRVAKAGLWRMSAYIFRRSTPSRFLPRPYQQR